LCQAAGFEPHPRPLIVGELQRDDAAFLASQPGGPLAHLAGEATDAFAARAKALAGWIRENAEERPLVSLLCAFQLGFAAGRWGPRRAKH
jgi:hypothetical protein